MVNGQNVGIGTNTPNASAKLEVQSTSGGVLIPRLTTTERDLIPSPANGLLIYNSISNRFEFYNGADWGPIASATSGGSLISDIDGDTKVDVEQNVDEDTIRIKVGGYPIAKLDDQTFHLESKSHGTFLGLNAGKSIPSSESWNTFIGHRSGEHTSTGISNTFTGAYSGNEGNKGNSNSFYGVLSGGENTGSNNTFLGIQAGQISSSASDNTYIGAIAGGQNTGSQNIGIGFFTAYLGSGNNNIGIGNYSLFNVGNGTSNLVAIGDSSLHKSGQNATFPFQGINNTAVGSKSLKMNQTGTSNTALGYHSLESNSSGSNNTSVGSSSLTKNSTGIYNTALGAISLSNNNGSNNTAVGYSAGRSNQRASNNTFVGSKSGDNNIGSGNTFIGSESGLSNAGGSSNTFVGQLSGRVNTIGERNSAFGNSAGGQGSSNTHIGFESGKSSTSDHSVAIGDSTLIQDAGYGNVAIGPKAGIGNLNGERNIYLGDSSGFNQVNGDENIFIGYKSGGFTGGSFGAIAIGTRSGLVSGHESISIGYEANSWGPAGNISIGKKSGFQGTGTRSIYLGNYMGYDNSENDRLFIGNLSYGTLIYGEMENRLVKIKNNLYSESLHINADNEHTHANLYMKTSVGSEGRVLTREAGTQDIYFGDIDNTGGSIISRTQSIERMRIVETGNVGIGTANPGDQLEIHSSENESPLRVKVGTTTRFRVHNNGGVSVGANQTPPSSGLRVYNLNDNVDGKLRADGAGNIYKDAGSKYISFSPRNFDSNPSAPLNLITPHYISVFGQSVMFAPINIPDGAQIKSLSIWCKDGQSLGNLNFNLIKNSHNSTLSSNIIGTASSSGSGNVLKAYMSNISEVVDNLNHSYWVEVYSSCPPTLSIDFTTVIVEYVD